MNIFDFIDSLQEFRMAEIKRICDDDLAYLCDMCNNISVEAKRVLVERREKEDSKK